MASFTNDGEPTEVRLLRKDGTYITTEIVATNHYHNPSINGMVIVCRDVTEKKKYMAELLEYNTKIESKVKEKQI